MTAFEEGGFLADDFGFLNKEFEGRVGELFHLCFELNKHAQAFQYSLSIHNEHLPEVICSVLYARVLSTFQASLILMRRGMRFQVEMLIRCILEPFFPLIAISKDLNFVNLYVEGEQHVRLKAIKKIIRYKERVGNIEELAGLRELMDLIKKRIEGERIKCISIFDCADKAGLVDYYDTLYSFYSNTLHASPRSLHEALELDSERTKIMAIKNEPDFERAAANLSVLANCLLKSIRAICEVFNLEEPSTITEISKRIHEISSEIT